MSETDYQIKLDIFQGPLDLLLHLIEENEIDIYNIPIALITEEYLAYLRTIQMLNLEVAGDFLVMAATLMQIKAKMLLPAVPSDDETAEFEEDPRLELAQKLIEYKKIKEASLMLQSLEGQQFQIYTRSGGDFADKQLAQEPEFPKGLSVWDLVGAFKVMLDSLEPKPIRAIQQQEVSIKQRMTEVLDLVTGQGQVLFKTVFNHISTKIGLITCFLAVLELIKLRKIIAFQGELFGDIRLALPSPENLNS